MRNKTYYAPERLDDRGVIDFIHMASGLFSCEGKRVSDIKFDLTRVSKVNILGLLLLYKFVEYSSTKNCFDFPMLHYNKYLETELKKYGFWNMLNDYMRNKRNIDYDDLDYTFKEDFFVAPIVLDRGKDFSSYKLRDVLYPKVASYYSYNHKIETIIFDCISEVIINFWEHAVDDTQSIIVAYGNKNKVEIACADTGNGIYSTLSPVLKPGMKKEDVLLKAFSKGVTSKKESNHMGYGLWILNEMVSSSGGKLQLFSEGAFVYNKSGKITKSICSYWKGTIIYISLPLNNPKTLIDLDGLNKEKLFKIKINFNNE
ncbi:MAG: ATP-binding protein [Bacteroidaceae bacterium]|nr:ATP-binding protein [Bacteroidaceae bacterium]